VHFHSAIQVVLKHLLCFSYRRRLFNMINNLPTIFEVVTGAAKKQTKEKAPNSTNKPNKPSSKMVSSYTLLLPAVQHSAYNFLCL
jgi:hypothetical protein